VCHMSRPPHPLWFNHPKNIWWGIQAVKLIIMQFSPWLSSYLLGPNILFNALFSRNLSVFLPQSERPSFAPIQHNWQNYSVLYFNR
jgi:hypothetical protein